MMSASNETFPFDLLFGKMFQRHFSSACLPAGTFLFFLRNVCLQIMLLLLLRTNERTR